MINPILPIFVVNFLHEGVDKLGIIVAVATFVSYILRMASGFLSDRFGITKPLVVTGYAISAITKPFIGFTNSYKSVAALRALERFGKALRSAPKDAMLAFYGEKKRMGKTFGFHKTLDIAGELFGSLFVFAFLYIWGESEEHIRTIFYATAIPGLLGLFIVLFFVEDIPKSKDVVKKFELTAKDRAVLKNLLYYFLFLLFFFSDAYYAISAKKSNIATMYIPLLFALSTLTQTLTSYISGLAIDKWGTKSVLASAYLFAIVSLGLLALRIQFLTWLAFVFLGLFTVFSLNANRAYIATSATNRGSVYGLFYAGVAVTAASGAYAIGYLWQRFGFEKAIGYAFVGSTLVFVLFLLRADYGTA